MDSGLLKSFAFLVLFPNPAPGRTFLKQNWRTQGEKQLLCSTLRSMSQPKSSSLSLIWSASGDQKGVGSSTFRLFQRKVSILSSPRLIFTSLSVVIFGIIHHHGICVIVIIISHYHNPLCCCSSLELALRNIQFCKITVECDVSTWTSWSSCCKGEAKRRRVAIAQGECQNQTLSKACLKEECPGELT